MPIIINPITTVLVTAAEFNTGEFNRFPFKYVLEESGAITYRTSFTCGRYLSTNATQIPGLALNAAAKKAAPIDEFQALAHGNLIPVEFLGQIEQFFKDVMKMRNGGGNFEAQTFIVWNDNDEEYRIVIPEQEVSSTRVSYDIQDILGDGDHIILDIHSHNTMGAFYSGTDDADDKKNSWISGVMGKLNTSTTQMVFRFNDGTGVNFPMEVSDIFDVGEESYYTPEDWLNKVKVKSYSPKNAGTGVGKSSTPGVKGKWMQGRWVPNSMAREPYTPPAYGYDYQQSFEDTIVGGNTQEEEDKEEIYEMIIDELTDLTNPEAKNVLDGAARSIRNQDFCPNLTEREMPVFMSVTTMQMLYHGNQIIEVCEEINRSL